MLPENRISTHTGEILLEEFINPLELSQVALAAHIGLPVQRFNEIVRGKRRISPETTCTWRTEASPRFAKQIVPQKHSHY